MLVDAKRGRRDGARCDFSVLQFPDLVKYDELRRSTEMDGRGNAVDPQQLHLPSRPAKATCIPRPCHDLTHQGLAFWTDRIEPVPAVHHPGPLRRQCLKTLREDHAQPLLMHADHEVVTVCRRYQTRQLVEYRLEA